MLYTAEGNLRSEDRELRRVARHKVRSALVGIEEKTARLVERIVAQADAHFSSRHTADQLLDRVQNHPSIRSEQRLIERYTSAFPELEEHAQDRLARTFRCAHRSLRETLAPFENARRFANTTGLRRH